MNPPLPVTDTREGARFQVRVTPRASRTAITGILGEGSEAVLKIALQAPPIEGRANGALIEFLADLLGVPRSRIEIAAGRHSRNKQVLVRGQTAAAVSRRIATHSEPSP